jgi:hypothetical protein
MKPGGTCLTAWLLFAAVAGAEPEEARVKAEVERLAASDANAWQRIPWTASLLAARTASEHEDRLLLLFSYEGNLELGRC